VNGWSSECVVFIERKRKATANCEQTLVSISIMWTVSESVHGDQKLIQLTTALRNTCLSAVERVKLTIMNEVQGTRGRTHREWMDGRVSAYSRSQTGSGKRQATEAIIQVK